MTASDSPHSGCYKLREAPHPAIMIDLRNVTGEHWAFPYSYMIFARYDKESISLRFSSHTVRILGRTLDAVYEGLLLQRVECIHAQDERYDLGPESEPFITAVEVKERESR